MRALAVLLALAALPSLAEARHTPRAAKHATRPKHRERVALPEHATGQSVGAPWQGRLRDPARLGDGDGYVIRRPGRAYGTRTTVDFIERVVTDWREQFPEAHVLAIGDLSAEHRGASAGLVRHEPNHANHVHVRFKCARGDSDCQ